MGMKPLHELYSELEDFFGRPLKNSEKDYCWICQRTGNYGSFWSELEHLQELNHTDLPIGTDAIHESDKLYASQLDGPGGDIRYKATPGNTIDWQRIRECEANKQIGIFLIPEKSGRLVCCAQFMGRGIFRIWLTIEQSEQAVKLMAAGFSMLRAVEKALGAMTESDKDKINQIMNN